MPRNSNIHTYLDQEYCEKMLAAIDEYERRKPRHRRFEEVERCREIISDSYHSNVALVINLRKYLATIRTGFNFLGIKKLHVSTGRSLLIRLIERAIRSKVAEAVLLEESRRYQELLALDQGLPREQLVIENTNLSQQLDTLTREYQKTSAALEQRAAEAELRYKEIMGQKIETYQKYITVMEERENLAEENIELQQTIIHLTEENQHLRSAYYAQMPRQIPHVGAKNVSHANSFHAMFGKRSRRERPARKGSQTATSDLSSSSDSQMSVLS